LYNTGQLKIKKIPLLSFLSDKIIKHDPLERWCVREDVSPVTRRSSSSRQHGAAERSPTVEFGMIEAQKKIKNKSVCVRGRV
jgi:hypothetical protein